MADVSELKLLLRATFCCSRTSRKSQLWGAPLLEKNVLVELVRAADVPCEPSLPFCGPAGEGNGRRPLLVDADTRSDVYVELAIVRELGSAVGTTKRLEDAFALVTPFQRSELCWNSRNPVWHHWLRFSGVGCEDPSLFLLCRLMDHNQIARDELIGFGCLPLRAALGDDEVPVSISLTNADADAQPRPCRLFLRCLQVVPKEKRLFLVRHAQSMWNKAQRDHDLAGLVAFDHPLSAEGVEEARDLHSRWQPLTSASTLDEAEAAFMSADCAFSSPLTRAVQTCLIGLRDHPALERSQLRLLASAREVKKVVGVDCVGCAWGEGIEAHVRRALAAALGEAEAAAAMRPLDPYSCTSQWWTPTSDSRLQVEERMAQLLNVALSTAGPCIIFGHSVLFRRLMRGRMSSEFRERRPRFARRLECVKLANAACVMLALRPNVATGAVEIVEAKLMFGSQMEDGLGEHGLTPAGSESSAGEVESG